MKYLVVSFILFFYTQQTFGQQEYFVYLQTDNNQPFYLRINKNVYSSTSSGYLILSKVADSAHNVTIGFPKDVYPEQQFNIPSAHKDAGYLIKNFSEKGWGLFNLQTLSVIMSSNPPVEKKNPEITGDKKTDAFSLLLSNAVNDTAILYTVNKPKKIIAAPENIAVQQNKPDSAAIAKQKPVKDTTATVKAPAPKNDSMLVAKTTTKPLKDTTQPHATKTTAATNNKKPASDSAHIVKNNAKPLVITTGAAAVTKIPPAPAGKNVSKPRKDTIILIGQAPSSTETVNTAKTKERKDTIIMMPSRAGTDGNGGVAKENKNAATVIPLPPVTKQQADTKSDSDIAIKTTPAETVKKDSVIAVAKTETIKPAEEKKDTIAEQPAKRLRPLVNKAAELLTDTSYVAMFVDESNEKFDTIRISIPFDEYVAKTKLQTAAPIENKPVDSSKIVKDLPETVVVPAAIPAIKKDSATQEKITKDTAATVLQQPATIEPVKKDSIADAKIPAENTAKKDSVTTAAIKLTDTTKATKAPVAIINSDCKEAATDSDIDKLRIKMLMVTSDEDRIALAKKVYKQKCFYVKHVKALSELFKMDEGKYKWFDAVYPFVYDSNNFALLSELITDTYYLNRFKAMLRN